jgi:hypothetical protein
VLSWPLITFLVVVVVAGHPEDASGRQSVYVELLVDDVENDRRITFGKSPTKSYVRQKSKERYWFSIPRRK